MSQSRWKGQSCEQNNLAKSAYFVSTFKAKYTIKKQSQCLEEQQNCFESKVAEGFGFININFLLRKGCGTCKVSFLMPSGSSSKIVLINLSVKINVKNIIL